MTPREQALVYAGRDYVPVFPCRPDKRPWTPHGFQDSTLDLATIAAWWRQWPDALISMPTGIVSGRWVLDIDVKRPEANGFDSLVDLGHLLPNTPMVHTRSGGLHAYFDAGDRELRNSAGLIGPGLDVRGEGGYVILPSPDSGYEWDPQWNFRTVKMVKAPDWLWPPKPSRPLRTEPIRSVSGLSPYGEKAVESAYNAIVRAGRANRRWSSMPNAFRSAAWQVPAPFRPTWRCAHCCAPPTRCPIMIRRGPGDRRRSI
jgi:Bifunctional DNA primase/polymerase, N-terminal